MVFRPIGSLLAALAAAALLTLAPAGCGGGPEDEAVAKALEETMAAAERGDWQALWDLSAPAAQKRLLELHRKLHEALAAVEWLYPEEERADARDALGEKFVADVPLSAKDAGPQLLERLLDPSRMRLDEKAKDGLLGASATVDGDRAVIHTSAGEEFTFERTEGGWRSSLVMDILEQSRRASLMLENANAIMKAADKHREAWKQSRDPRTAQGSYNIVRGALEAKPPQAKILFTLIAEPERKIVLEALERSRKIQKRIQRRTAKSKRKAAYEKYGLLDFVGTETDLALFTSWTKSERFKPLLAATDAPDKVEGDPLNGPATVITASGGKVPMVRSKDGYWRLSGLGEAIKEAFHAPLDAAEKQLDGGDEDEKAEDADKKKGK